MRRHCLRWTAGAVLSISFGLAAPAALAQEARPTCAGLVFSSEEDFLSQGPRPFDGNPLISEGDLIAFANGGSVVCARNRELVGPFDVTEDLGVDAVDVVDPDRRLFAFSTELDSPHGNFTSGDLLATNGASIPLAALLGNFTDFKLEPNLGLDAIHFVGPTDQVVNFLENAREIGRERFLDSPQTTAKLLQEFEIDLWISLEGTAPPTDDPQILDGDLLSVAQGSIVIEQHDMFDSSIPAGVPKRGVDFGIDAVTGSRKPDIEALRFSTEILFRGERGFTDGDLLRLGGAVAVNQEALIRALEPAADFVGLDAVSLGEVTPEQGRPELQQLCGKAATNFGPDGLWRANYQATPPGAEPHRPCGAIVPIEGRMSDSGITRFRIAYREAGTPRPAIGTADAIETAWNLERTNTFGPCQERVSSSLGSGGWTDTADYWDAKQGTGALTNGCANSQMPLAAWNTRGLPDPDGRYVVWMEWETAGGTLRAGADHVVQLDNTAPAMPNGFEVRMADGSGDVVPACGESPVGESEFQVWAEFVDAHHHGYELTVVGGRPTVTHIFQAPDGERLHTYYDTDHEPAATVTRQNTDETGTAPDNQLVHLRNIDLTELGDSYGRCCYMLQIEVFDRALRHRFTGNAAHPTRPHRAIRRTTFEAGA